LTPPLRVFVALLAATMIVTVPFPDPDGPAATVIHAAVGVAVQAQPAGAVTVKEVVPPAAGTLWLAGVSA
jgi:hypothetical protein